MNIRSFSFFDKDYKDGNEDHIRKSDSIRNWYINNNVYFFEFDDNLESAINDPNSKKKNLSHYTFENIRNMNNYHEIKEQIRHFLGVNNE